MKYLMIALLSLMTMACAPSGSSSGSSGALLASPISDNPISHTPTTASEVASALSGKFIMSDGTHSIEFQGTQIIYTGISNSAKHLQNYNPGPGFTTRNWQCQWQGTYVSILEFPTYKAVNLTVQSSTSANVLNGSIQNCQRTVTTSFSIEFTSPDCFQAGFALETEKLTYCRE